MHIIKRIFDCLILSVILVSCSNSPSKGDGSHFYSYLENGKVTYHSLRGCDLIGNAYNIDEYANIDSYDFCSKCMDDSLIILCKQHLAGVEESTPVIKSPDELMPEEIVTIEIKKYNRETGLLELKVQNISPYDIEHSMIVIAYGGTSRFLPVNNLASGDEIICQKPIHPRFYESELHTALFEVRFKDCKLKMF